MSILKASGLGKSYDGRPVFRHVQLALSAGAYVVRGKNGSGKSTLLKLLAGITRPDEGSIQVNGYGLDRTPDKVKARIGYMPDSDEFYEFVTPMAIWRLVADARHAPLHEALAMCGRLGLSAYIDEPFGALSQGTRRKVFLVGAFMGPPAVILLDEPSNALDAPARTELCKMIVAAARASVVLMSTHDTELVASARAQVLELTAHGTLAGVEAARA